MDAAAAVSANVASVSSSPLGMTLKDWVRLYRRADVDPAPQPSSSPVTLPDLPAADRVDARSPLLPTADTLRYGTVPLMAGTLAKAAAQGHRVVLVVATHGQSTAISMVEVAQRYSRGELAQTVV